MAHRCLQVVPAGTRHPRQPDASDPWAVGLRGNDPQGLAGRTAPPFAGSFSTDEGFVHCDRAGPAVSARTNPGPPQLVQPVPSGVLAAQPQAALHSQSAGSVFLVSDMPPSLKPKSQGFVRVREQRARSDRKVPLTPLATENPALHFPELSASALGTGQSLRPAQLDEIFTAGVLRVKLITKRQQIFGIVRHAQSLGSSSQVSRA